MGAGADLEVLSLRERCFNDLIALVALKVAAGLDVGFGGELTNVCESAGASTEDPNLVNSGLNLIVYKIPPLQQATCFSSVESREGK